MATEMKYSHMLQHGCTSKTSWLNERSRTNMVTYCMISFTYNFRIDKFIEKKGPLVVARTGGKGSEEKAA